MMTKMTRLAVSLAALLLTQGALACDYPERIKDMPDGSTATRDDMIASKKAVETYISTMNAYLSCIEAEEAQAVIALGGLDDKAKAQRAENFNKKYNAAVEEMNLVAEEFNIQLRAYKEQND